MFNLPKRSIKAFNLLFITLLICFPLAGNTVEAIRPLMNITVLGDPHLPGRNIRFKEKVIKTVDSWNEVDLVTVVGDLCKTTGTKTEYDFAKSFMGKIKKPLSLITGNHDYVFADGWKPGMKYTLAGKKSRKAKLKLFKSTFGNKGLWAK